MDRIIDINICGNHIKKGNNNAGVRGEGNVTLLRISFDESWDDYAKTVTFWDARGANPVERILTTDYLENIEDSTRLYVIPIPEEPLAIAGKLTFVIDGYVVGKRKRSLSDTLIVEDAPIADNAGEPVDPTPTQAEQLQAEIETIKGDIQKVANAEEEARLSADDAYSQAVRAKEYKNAAETAANRADNLLFRYETASKTPPRIVDGNWYIYSVEAQDYVDTGVKAQAGSNVYLGVNPPEYADVWIDPEGELEGRTLTVGANGDITVDEFIESFNSENVSPYQYDNIILLEDIVANRIWINEWGSPTSYSVRCNSLDLNRKTLTFDGVGNVSIETKSIRNGFISGYGEGDESHTTIWFVCDVRDVEMLEGRAAYVFCGGHLENSKANEISYSGCSTISNCSIGALLWFGTAVDDVITVINSEIGYCGMAPDTTAVLIQNKIGVLHLTNYIGDTIPDGSLENKVLIGNTIEEYATPELKSIELAKESYVDKQIQNKADKSTTLKGYGIEDAFTKGETRNMLSPLQEQIDSISDALPRVDAIEADVEGLQKQINEEAHFRGYLSTNVKIQSLNATPNDFAYSAESGTKWIYDEVDGWKDTGTPVPDQLTPASNATPLMNGTASAGTSEEYARGDHRHPTDATRASVEELNSLKRSIETALDNIIAIQNSLIGGDAE